MAAGDDTPAAAPALSRPANLYEAMLAFAEAYRAALESIQAGSGKITLMATWNAEQKRYQVLFGGP